MITTVAPRASLADRARAAAIATFTVIAATGLIIAALVIAVILSSEGEKTVLVGQLTGGRIAASALVVTTFSATVVIAMFMKRGRRLLWMVPTQAAGGVMVLLGLFVLWFTSSNTVTAIRYEGCPTGYVIEEESRFFQGAGTIYRQNDVLLTQVATTVADDGYQPFQDGRYVVRQNGNALDVWYWRGDRRAGVVTTDGAPALTLPAVTVMADC